MDDPIRILYLEDPDFSALVSAVVESEKACVEVVSVGNFESLATALQNRSFDLILADGLSFAGSEHRATEVVRERCPGVPFVMMSEALGAREIGSDAPSDRSSSIAARFEQLKPIVSRALKETRERLQRERSNAESFRREAYLTALTENSLDVFSILDGEGVFRYNSASITRTLGYEPGQLIGSNALSLVHPDDLPVVLRTFSRVVQKADKDASVEFRFRHSDGSYRQIQSVMRNRFERPEISGILATSRDVTDLKRMAAERTTIAESLRKSEMAREVLQRLACLGTWEMLLSSPDDIGANQFCWSDEASNILGYASGPLNTSCEVFLQLVHPDDRLQVIDGFRQVARFNHPIDLEYRIRAQDGAERNIKQRAECEFDAGGRPFKLRGIVADVTELKRSEEESRELQRLEAVGQLAGGVAHDFNNLLTVVHGHASLLLGDETLPASALKSAGQIIEAADRATGLTRQLLAFGRRQLLQPRRLDLNRLVSNITVRLEKILGENIAVDLNYHPHGAFVRADPNMMEQVLMSLALNARDALAGDGLLSIRTETINAPANQKSHPDASSGKYVRLTVEDNGCGISPTNLPRIFEPFFTTKDIGKGTGLGLAAVYGILKQHRGWIEVESELGKGSAFHVFLPEAAEESVSIEKKKVEEPVRGGSETILVVEDETPVRELVCKLLTGYGYHVLRAETGVKALDLWRHRKEKIDLLLTDLVMPDRLSGRELADELRADVPDLKVIFMSGHSPEVAGKDFALQPGLHYLQKPYDSKKLAASVRNCLDSQIKH
jgi:PAS domain S-box-containing protein